MNVRDFITDLKAGASTAGAPLDPGPADWKALAGAKARYEDFMRDLTKRTQHWDPEERHAYLQLFTLR